MDYRGALQGMLGIINRSLYHLLEKLRKMYW
jgi:hypothetical protein